MKRSATRTPSLRKRIGSADLDRLLFLVMELDLAVPDFAQASPRIFRDPGDDYLLAHASHERVDYLVSGDLDLLVPRQIGYTFFDSPTEFLTMLNLESPL